MEPSPHIGKICAFYTKLGQVKGCVPLPGATRAIGAVIASKPTTPAQPGNIPNHILTVRGRSGRTAEVSMVEQFCCLYETWHEAAEDAKRQQG
jgi:hypothetical protein